MGFKDKLVKQKDGSYVLSSKSKKIKKKGACIECGENPVVRDLLYQYNAEDMLLVRDYIEEHLTSYPKHESMKPNWCDACKSLIGYTAKLKNAKIN